MSSNSDWNTIAKVSDSDIEFFRNNGYQKLGRIFTEQELNELRSHIDKVIAGLEAGERPEQLDVPHLDDPFYFKYLAHPRLLDIVEQFIGPDIALWSSHIIAKRQGDGLGIPWHQDGAYWTDMLKPMNVLTVWLAVDESSVENGSMQVIPGSHISHAPRKYASVDGDKNLFDSEIQLSENEASLALNLELQPGEAHLHDAWTIHGSQPNFSPKRRCGYTMRYMPASVKCSHRHWDQLYDKKLDKAHNIYLLRGKDRSGGFNKYTSLP